MKKHWKWLAGVVAICLVLSVMSNAMAEDANVAKEIPKEPNKAAPQETPKESPKEAPKEQAKEKNLVIGILTIVKDNDGNIAEMTITAHKDLKYKVVIDEKSKEMANNFADKRVRVEGTIETKGDVKWLTVETFGDSKPRPDAKPGGKKQSKTSPETTPVNPRLISTGNSRVPTCFDSLLRRSFFHRAAVER
jgi:hypothetical protein